MLSISLCESDGSRCVLIIFFFFKQKTAYEMRISDWSSDVCSSDLRIRPEQGIEQGTDRCPPHEAPPQRQRQPVALRRADGAEPAGGIQRREPARQQSGRSEERRVGKECVSTCRSRCASHHSKKKSYKDFTSHTS